MNDRWTVERMSLALQRAGALSKSHMTYHDLARDVLAAFGGEEPTRRVESEGLDYTTEDVERMAVALHEDCVLTA